MNYIIFLPLIEENVERGQGYDSQPFHVKLPSTITPIPSLNKEYVERKQVYDTVSTSTLCSMLCSTV